MHIILAEKYLDGRKVLKRILENEGYEVSIAKSASQAITLLKEGCTNIVLVNVFHCMYSSEVEPKLTIRKIDTSSPALLVTCSSSDESLNGLLSAANLCSGTAFELPSTTEKNTSVNRILQMCSALRQSRHLSPPDGDFDWRRFSLLMHLPTDAYLGSRFLR
jgi:CheY-like chemotaxis protein